jgi:hypothetical protein
MDIQTRKIRFIQEVLWLKNEKVIEKLEKLLHQERKKIVEKGFSHMSMEELNSRINQAEDDSENSRLFNTGDILKEIDSWK